MHTSRALTKIYLNSGQSLFLIFYSTTVYYALPVSVYLLVQELKQSGRVELVVLDNRLFGWAWRLRSFGFRHPEGVSKISIHSVVGFSLSLGRLNPINKFVLLHRKDSLWSIISISYDRQWNIRNDYAKKLTRPFPM